MHPYTTPTVIISTHSFQDCCKNRNGKTSTRLLPLSGIVCWSKFAFLKQQDNFSVIRTHYYWLAFNYWSRACFRSHDSTIIHRLKVIELMEVIPDVLHSTQAPEILTSVDNKHLSVTLPDFFVTKIRNILSNIWSRISTIRRDAAIVIVCWP